jgi:long-subunit acyl-CoA synthetase (AMP-forming)
VTTVSGAMESKAYAKLIEEAIIKTIKNGQVCPSNASKIQKFLILPIDFSVSTDELTATLKLKRGVVVKKYHEEIERMYASTETYVKYGGAMPVSVPRTMSL